MTVAVIDIEPLRGGDLSDPDAEATIDEIDRACTHLGFFAVVGHGLDEALADVFEAAASFFGLPADVKASAAMVGNDGYLAPGLPRTGRKEMLDVGLGAFERWPSIPELDDRGGLAGIVTRYQAAALDVARAVLSGLAVALEAEPDFFARRMQRPDCFLRMIHSGSQSGSGPDPATSAGTGTGTGTGTGEQPLATGPHTDYGAITLLATDGVAGLEVRPIGGDWTPVVAPHDALVVNLGDMLARWTNDRYVSTPHRVVAQPGSDRYSLPFFVNPDPDTIVEALPSCIGPDRAARYAPVTAGRFLQGRIDGTITSGDGVHG